MALVANANLDRSGVLVQSKTDPEQRRWKSVEEQIHQLSLGFRAIHLDRG